MGRGNWYLRGDGGPVECCEAWIFDISGWLDDDADPWDAEDAWDLLLDLILGALPGAFWPEGRGSRDGWRRGFTGQDDRVLARSRLLQVVIEGGGESHHCGIAVAVRDDVSADEPSLANLAGVHVERVSRQLQAAMHSAGVVLSVRTGAWTSAPLVLRS